ncbi:hypothetical protein [Thermus thermamylovorans]|uniref:hypothetical protein n=1 Tax=Thermus thermamylovorans TaxID=2509362 RepID=UPI00191C1238|nr:hypothetical protein [Thermus thermamylovorans]
MRSTRAFWFLAGAALALVLAACGGQMGSLGTGGSSLQAGSAPLTGAIYTTLGDGSLVNGNVYDAKEDVYLNGGPPPNAPCTAAGLPDGEYYFQVTDPSGATLLTTDPIDHRRVRVQGGVFVEYTGATYGGTRLTGSGRCPGAISVQLYPYADTPNPGGEYKVWVTPVADYAPGQGVHGFLPARSKTDNFKVRMRGEEPAEVAIWGYKWYDANTNGMWDPGEPAIPGWRIEKVPPTPSDVTYTSASGQYSFLVPRNSGAYTITEVPPPPGWWPAGRWLNTTPTSGTVTVGTADVHGPDFGNVCLGAGGGRTLGFWSNRNGQSAMNGLGMNAILAELRDLNLVRADGNPFDPWSYSEFRTWLLGANATNMAYMLSAQMAAMYLNVRAGFVDGNALVYAPGTTSANAAGFATVNALLAEANAELALHPTAYDGSPWRAYQEALKDAFDWANNNRTFVQPGPEACPFDSPY